MKIGFAGSGNMAAALARGFAAAERGPELMLFTDAGSGRAASLAAEVGGETRPSLGELARDADLILLAVKPKALPQVAPELQDARAVVSVLGATTVADLEAAFPNAAVLRAMPNVAVEVGKGVTCHTAVPEALKPAVELLGEVGRVVELPEELLDPATAVMGCAPAYIALAAGAISDAGERAGLDPELARSLVADATEGMGALLHGHEAGALQTAIASPGGSTEAGLEQLASHGAADAFAAAVDASLERMAGRR
jgi:pyrroline-5-carboxylate reductase